MERITNKDITKAKKRKFMTESKRAVDKIMKGDNKLDMSKIKIRPSDRDKSLADAYRFRMDLPASMSDADVLKMYRSKGVPKMNKKSITELPTNRPRLKAGATIIGDLDKDGKMSGYETARQKAIEKNMEPKKAKTGIAFLDNMQKDTMSKKRLSSQEKRDLVEISNLVSPEQKKNLGKNLRNIRSLGGDGQLNKKVRNFLKYTGGPKAQKIAKKAGNPQLQEKQGFIGAAGANKRKK
tara:strand:+ start:234 stop:947 length:714 start_codon:yes stop_codon:yes gene_type:complete